MSKILKNKTLLAAMTLAASLATFGCSTNYNHGNGEPAPGLPGVGPSAPTSGSSRLTTSSGDALAIMQRTRGTGDKGRVLGPVNPPATGQARAVSNGATTAFDGTITQLTVNSSISNPYGPQAAVVNGAGDGFAGDVLAGTVTNGTTGTTAATTPGVTTAGTAATPTSAALPLTTGAFASGTATVTPTVSSAAVTTPTAATSAITLNRGAVGTTGSGLRVTQGATGGLVISNVKK